MPRYFFDVHTTACLVVDEVGEELDSPDVAVEVALLQCTDLGVGGATPDTTVRDQSGCAVLIVTLDIRIQRMGEHRGLAPSRVHGHTPALIERGRALIAGSRRAAAELDQAVTHSAWLVGEMKRCLVTPRLALTGPYTTACRW